MRESRVHRAASRDQRLADHLSTEHALPSDLWRASAKQIQLKLFEVENLQELLDGSGHAVAFDFLLVTMMKDGETGFKSSETATLGAMVECGPGCYFRPDIRGS
jgi:hypothetical protein